MSIHQPTYKEKLQKKLESIHETLELLNKHEHSWNEAERYSAKWTRRELQKQINNLCSLIDTCEG